MSPEPSNIFSFFGFDWRLSNFEFFNESYWFIFFTEAETILGFILLFFLTSACAIVSSLSERHVNVTAQKPPLAWPISRSCGHKAFQAAA